MRVEVTQRFLTSIGATRPLDASVVLDHYRCLSSMNVLAATE